MSWLEYLNLWFYYYGTTFLIILACALVITLIIAIAFLPRRKKQSSSAVVRGVHSFFSFNVFWIEKLIKLIFIFVAALLLCIGVYFIITIDIVTGLILIASILFLRLLFETIYVMLSIREQLVQINKKTPDVKADYEPQRSAPAAPENTAAVSYAAPVSGGAAPEVICKNCGAKLTPDSKFCVTCGNAVTD